MLSKKTCFFTLGIFILSANATSYAMQQQRITFDNLDRRKYRVTNALYSAVCAYDERMIARLVKNADAEINIQPNTFFHTLLHVAITNHRIAPSEDTVVGIVNLLLLNQAIDLTLVDSNGDTPLHLALEEECAIVADILIDAMIEKKVTINIQNKQGNTVLHLATKLKRHDFVKKLLKTPGVEINLTNKNNQTALDIASELGWRNIEELLQNHGGQLAEPLSENDSQKSFERLPGEVFDLD